MGESLESLQRELSRLDRERQRIMSLLETYEGPTHGRSLSARIVNETIGLLRLVDHPLPLITIVWRMEQIGIDFKETKNRSGYVSAVLTNEIRRKYPRIFRVGRGLYAVKKYSQSEAGGWSDWLKGKERRAP